MKINGPINVIRMEGKINGIDKVIYLFMDYHSDPKFETECDDIESVGIKKYFVDNFKKLNKTKKTYDFFFEIYPTNIVKKLPNYRGRYIDSIDKIFIKGFNIKKGVVSRSNLFPNIRLHYIDIRDYLSYMLEEAVEELFYTATNIKRSLTINVDDITFIKNGLMMIMGRIKYLYDIIYKGKYKDNGKISTIPESIHILAKYSENEYNMKIKSFVNKILDDYKHPNIKKKLNNIINNELRMRFEALMNLITETLPPLDNMVDKLMIEKDRLVHDKVYKATYKQDLSLPFYRSMISFIDEKIEHLGNLYQLINLRMMDLYFLRRFLDKDYVKNAIVYTGAEHSVSYIFSLVKDFGFKITHYSYIKYDLDEVMELINKITNWQDLKGIFYPIKLKQCSDVSEFPKLFM